MMKRHLILDLDNMTLKIKAIILAVAILLFGGLCATICLQNNKIKNVKHQLEVAVNNNLAYESENAALNGRLVAFQMTTDQLAITRDSLTMKLNNMRKQLKIKDKELQAMQLLISENHKIDSIFVHDTIFNKGAVLDTTIKDDWSRLQLHAEYPNAIITDYSFVNSTAIFAKTSRVILEEPKKCWIGRLFQKKYTVCEIEVIQENPYCTNKEQRFVKIIEK